MLTRNGSEMNWKKRTKTSNIFVLEKEQQWIHVNYEIRDIECVNVHVGHLSEDKTYSYQYY